MILQETSTCILCNRMFETDIPVLVSSTGGGFLADLQPGYSAPMHAIWEMVLFSCPSCGYTVYGPRSLRDADELSPELKELLRAFARRQKPSRDAIPGPTSKHELYALQLDHIGAEDHIVGDHFLRASWSARIYSRQDEARRLRSLAAVRYERAIRSTATECLEDEIIARYLLVELYRLLDEAGEMQLHFDSLVPLWGESFMGDSLIDIAKKQHEFPKDDVVMSATTGVMDFVGYYRALSLDSRAYAALKAGNTPVACRLFKRLFSICEGPLRVSIQGAFKAGMQVFSPLDQYGFFGAVGLQECYRSESGKDWEISKLTRLIEAAERHWKTTAGEVLNHKLELAHPVSKPGWRYLSRRDTDPEILGRTVWFGDRGDLRKEVEKSVREAEQSLWSGNYVEAATIAQNAALTSRNEMKRVDSGNSEFIDYSSFKLRAVAVENAARLSIDDERDLNECIQALEMALRDYPPQGGPRNNPVYAFVLCLLSIANKRKGDSEVADRAWSKAAELIDDSSVELFHWGRLLSRCPLTRDYAETTFNQAYISGGLAKSWVEGAAAMQLAGICEKQGRYVEALEFLKSAVRINYFHLPTLRDYDSISSWKPGLDWYLKYADSAEAKLQLRPPARRIDSAKPRVWSRIARGLSRSHSHLKDGDHCRSCGEALKSEDGDNILIIKWDLIDEWLSQYWSTPLGLRCKHCGVFGACCWNWHTYDSFDDLPEPAYVPLCPNCGDVLRGGFERVVGPVISQTPEEVTH